MLRERPENYCKEQQRGWISFVRALLKAQGGQHWGRSWQLLEMSNVSEVD